MLQPGRKGGVENMSQGGAFEKGKGLEKGSLGKATPPLVIQLLRGGVGGEWGKGRRPRRKAISL